MKLLILSVALAVITVTNAHDSEYWILKKWAVHKAFEGCFGKELMKQYLVKLKSSYAKCMSLDAPELELPMFKSFERTSGIIVKSAHSNKGYNHNHDSSFSLDSMVKKYLLRKAFENVMDDEEDSSQIGFEGPLRHALKHRRRYRRDHHTEEAQANAEAEHAALGDRLSEKLQVLKEQIRTEVGNWTCMLKECGILDSENNFSTADDIIKGMEDYEIADPWLKENIEDDVRMCHSIATSLPQEFLDECFFGPEFQKVKYYKKCLKKRKMRTCMNYDIKQQLEENFAPLEELVEQTEMDEESLLPLVRKLLHGDTDMNQPSF